MKKIHILFSIILLAFYSCNSSSTTEVSNTVTNEQIQSIIDELKESNTIDEQKVSELLESINTFTKNNPKDKNTPSHLELKAKYLGALGRNKEALDVYNTLYTEYKDSKNGPDALFMMAFLYEENLKNKDKAVELYTKYLNEFPNGEFAKDAKIAIEIIDVPLEELMKRFEEKRKKEQENSTEQ